MTATLERKVELNPFSQREGRKPEKENKVEKGVDKLVDKVFEEYKRFNANHAFHIGVKKDAYLSNLHYVMSPQQIELVFQNMRNNKRRFFEGEFLTKLMQNAYDKGYNDFILTTGDLNIENIAYGLEGTKEKPIQVSIFGNVGDDCGTYSEHSKLTINGNTGNGCGIYSKGSFFHITGDVGVECGLASKKSIFTIDGYAGNNLGHTSQESTYILNGEVGDFFVIPGIEYESNCNTFQTPNPETYKKLIEQIPKGNEVILL